MNAHKWFVYLVTILFIHFPAKSEEGNVDLNEVWEITMQPKVSCDSSVVAFKYWLSEGLCISNQERISDLVQCSTIQNDEMTMKANKARYSKLMEIIDDLHCENLRPTRRAWEGVKEELESQ